MYIYCMSVFCVLPCLNFTAVNNDSALSPSHNLSVEDSHQSRSGFCSPSATLLCANTMCRNSYTDMCCATRAGCAVYLQYIIISRINRFNEAIVVSIGEHIVIATNTNHSKCS